MGINCRCTISGRLKIRSLHDRRRYRGRDSQSRLDLFGSSSKKRSTGGAHIHGMTALLSCPRPGLGDGRQVIRLLLSGLRINMGFSSGQSACEYKTAWFPPGFPPSFNDSKVLTLFCFIGSPPSVPNISPPVFKPSRCVSGESQTQVTTTRRKSFLPDVIRGLTIIITTTTVPRDRATRASRDRRTGRVRG